MRKAVFTTAMSLAITLAFCSIGYADNYDLSNMTTAELKELKSTIDEEIEANHEPSSGQKSSVEDVTKAYVEAEYGEDNVSWAWFDYDYTKDWDFYTLSTNADITKHDGGKAKYPVYSEVVANGDDYKVAYVKIGEEEIYNDRANLIKDQRVLKMLGLDAGEASAEEKPAEESSEAPSEEAAPAAEDPVIAQRGDKSDSAYEVQEMLLKLGYLDGVVDGSYGEKTENSVKQFQTDNGLEETGVVTQSVYNELKAAADAAPEPEEVISVSAVELYNQFDNNAVAAKENYKGKTIQVTGTVGSIDETIWGTLYITLNADEWGITSVQCYFPKDEASKLASLGSGQTVTVKGSNPEKGIINVELEDCTIVG